MKRIVIMCVSCIIMAVAVYGTFFMYYRMQVRIADVQTEKNHQKAQDTLAAIPAWHKKIKTEQLIKIGIITDTHVRPTRINKTDKSEQAPRILDQDELRPLQNFVAQMKEFQPEFIVHLGDVIEGTKDPDYLGMTGLRLVREELQKTGRPTHWILGNHELRSVTKEQFLESVHQENLDFVFDKGDYRFIFLDGNYSFVFNVTEDGEQSVFGSIPDETIAWLKEQLATDKRTFIFCHYPMTTQLIVSADNEPKKAIANAVNLQDILNEYRVEAVFSGHVEALNLTKDQHTRHYLLTGTKKSKKFPESYYALTINGSVPSVDMYYMASGNAEPTKIAFDENMDDVAQPVIETESVQAPVSNDEKIKNVNSSRISKKRIEIIKTPAKEGSGLEWHEDQWISIDDSGYIFAGDKKAYDSKNDLEGIAFCNEKFYVVVERSDEILILNKDYQQSGSIPFKIGGGNTGAEGIACSKNGLYITEQGGNAVYEIDLNGKIIDTIKITHNDLSGADFYNGHLYILSDEADAVMIVDGRDVIDEIKVGKTGEWEGVKVVDDVIYIIEDDEN